MAERAEIRCPWRKVTQLRPEREILVKAARVRSEDRLEPTAAFELVHVNRAADPSATMCRVLEVSPSGYGTWRCSATPLRRRKTCG
jgi:hypothetical protein